MRHKPSTHPSISYYFSLSLRLPVTGEILMAKTLIVNELINFSVYLQFWLSVIGYIFPALQVFHWVSGNPLIIQYLNPAKSPWEAIATIINNFLNLIFCASRSMHLKTFQNILVRHYIKPPIYISLFCIGNGGGGGGTVGQHMVVFP